MSRDPDVKRCAICRSADRATVHLRVYGERAGRTETVLRCGRCGLVYVDEPVGRNKPFDDSQADDLRQAWEAQFPDSLDTYSAESWGTRFQEADSVMETQVQAVEDLLGDRLSEPGCTIVEIGSARGYLLARLAEAYPRAHLIGVEPSPVMAELAKKSGATIVNGVPESAVLEPHSVDAVIGFGSFIQVRDPLSALRHLNPAVKPGGRILLDSPNDASLFRWLVRTAQTFPRLGRILGLSSLIDFSTRRIYNPGRFYYYTAGTYSKLLKKAGFEVTESKQRPARYVIYGKADLGPLMRWLMRGVAFAEKLLRRQSWVEVRGTKVRELDGS